MKTTSQENEPAPVGDEWEVFERLDRFAGAIAKACERWGWTHATTEVELIKSIDDLLEFKRLLTEGKYLLYTHDGADFGLIEWKEFEAGEGLCLCEEQPTQLQQARAALDWSDGAPDDLRRLRETLNRWLRFQYPPWETSGGPRECKHGRAEGVPCSYCDEQYLMEWAETPLPPPSATGDALDGESALWGQSGRNSERSPAIPARGGCH